MNEGKITQNGNGRWWMVCNLCERKTEVIGDVTEDHIKDFKEHFKAHHRDYVVDNLSPPKGEFVMGGKEMWTTKTLKLVGQVVEFAQGSGYDIHLDIDGEFEKRELTDEEKVRVGRQDNVGNEYRKWMLKSVEKEVKEEPKKGDDLKLECWSTNIGEGKFLKALRAINMDGCINVKDWTNVHVSLNKFGNLTFYLMVPKDNLVKFKRLREGMKDNGTN